MNVVFTTADAYSGALDRMSDVNPPNIVYDDQSCASNGMTLKTDQNPEDLWISHPGNHPVCSNPYNQTAFVKYLPYGAPVHLEQAEIKCEPIGKETIRHDYVSIVS